MPVRAFSCKGCGKVRQEFQTLHDEDVPLCPCGGEVFRDYSQEGGRFSTGEFREPIVMRSVGFINDPETERAFRRAFPDAEIREDAPVARNRREKLRYLNWFGYQENS